MNLLLQNLVPLLSTALWAALWSLGGFWLARASFTLRRNELALAGLGLGLAVETWVANLTAQFIPTPASFWVAAVVVFLAGLAFNLPHSGDLLDIPIFPRQWLLLALLAFVFVSVGRGLAISDDFQNLPLTSVIAAGDIPPHFPLDPQVNYGYHYFSMLFAGQLMRIMDLYTWTALDMARGFGFALSILLWALFVQRVTNSRLAAFVGGLLYVFAGGTRWLLLLLPPSMLASLSEHVQLIGSGLNSGPDLASAMVNTWMTSGAGPYPFPFAYVNGFNPTAGMLYHSGSGGLPGVVSGFIMLTHNKWKGGWRAWVVMSALFAAMALANEVGLVQCCLGFTAVAVIWMAVKKSVHLPFSLWRWFVPLGAGGLISLVQGGVITGVFMGWLAKIVPGLGVAPAYHTFEFSLFWPPALLSTHLGNLSLTDPYQLLVILVEIGPVILLLPLAIAWAAKAFRFGRWYEAALAVSAFGSLGLSFVELSGAAGSTALTRAQSMVVGLCDSQASTGLWLWARHRSEKIKAGVCAFFLVIMLGGVVLFGIQMISVPEKVYSDFLNTLDAHMAKEYWNRLPVDAMVFDPVPYRAPVVFARPNTSSYDYFERKPEWTALVDHPDPYVLHAAGYDYAYVDLEYWEDMGEESQAMLQSSCVVVVQVYEQEFPRDFRRLLDLRACE